MNDAYGKKAVANMSLGFANSSGNTSVDKAVRQLRKSGVVVVAAAGNTDTDACSVSPAKEPRAITVGSVSIVFNTTKEYAEDRRSSFSNYGKCVDIWAPGEKILSASHRSDTGCQFSQGTSMAAPHVSGAIALYLENGASPSEAEKIILSQATMGKVGDKKSESPDRLLYIGHGTPCKEENDDGNIITKKSSILPQKNMWNFCCKPLIFDYHHYFLSRLRMPAFFSFWV
uniref:subtilisin n=1 Tax=Corethron hystrix TaxID=216773 RepID=A0A6U5GUQ0_9STRA